MASGSLVRFAAWLPRGTSMKRGKHTIAVPPGETIKEYFEMRGMTI